jgi:hypothetical protein
MTKTLERYLFDDLDRDVIDHVVRARRDADGKVTFYIRPANVSGDTCEFVVTGCAAVPTGVALGDVGQAEPHVSETAINEAVMMLDCAGALVQRTLETNNSDLRRGAEDVAAKLLNVAKARLGGAA